MVKRNLKGRGDKLSANAPLDNQLEAGKVAKQRDELREKQKRKREDSQTDEVSKYSGKIKYYFH